MENADAKLQALQPSANIPEIPRQRPLSPYKN